MCEEVARYVLPPPGKSYSPVQKFKIRSAAESFPAIQRWHAMSCPLQVSHILLFKYSKYGARQKVFPQTKIFTRIT
ncbi:hypothetical protein V1477_016372 [Vespula maculifrons]|uniref:Uncharacterized protein n=1 Tax=Vespula maculifrons TaxID=7453 RepID=A0ABD2BCV1_VESMC